MKNSHTSNLLTRKPLYFQSANMAAVSHRQRKAKGDLQPADIWSSLAKFSC